MPKRYLPGEEKQQTHADHLTMGHGAKVATLLEEIGGNDMCIYWILLKCVMPKNQSHQTDLFEKLEPLSQPYDAST